MTSKARIRLKVGVVGVGRLGRVYVRDLAGRIPETTVVAVADTNRALADQIAAEFDVPKAYSSAQDLIDDRDVDAVVILVMEQAAQDQTQDLQTQLQQMQQVNSEKQELRQLEEEMQQAQAQLRANVKNAPCKTPFCQSLPARLAELNRSGAMLPRPVHLQVPANMTVEQFGQTAAQINQALASVSDMSQQMQLAIQTAMDQRSKALDAISNMEKSMGNTASAVVQNLK